MALHPDGINHLSKPHPLYPERVLQAMLQVPDEAMWSAVTSEPPVRVPG